jgi:hypothetical protein
MARLSKVRITDDGRWFEYYVDPDGVEKTIRFKVGSTASASYKRKQRGLARRHLDTRPGDRFSSGGFRLGDNSMQVMQIDLALELIQDWDGVENDDGTEDKFSTTRAEEVFNDPAHGDIVEFVHECGANLAAHAAEAKEETVGNSPAASPS